jgi:parallel beta-helix repeat protein
MRPGDAMTDDPQRLERSLREWMTDARPPLADRDARIHDILAAVEERPRTRRGVLGRWLEHGAREGRTKASDRSPDADRPTHSLLNASALVALLAVAAVAVSSVQRSPALPSAPAGDTYVVAADGSGDFPTIGEAVAAVDDGDTILVRPGTYRGPVDIDSDITVRGLGAASDVRLAIGSSALGGSEPPFGFRLTGSDASVGNLSITGPSGAVGVLVNGGSPIMDGLIVRPDEDLIDTEDDFWTAFYFAGEATPVLRGSQWDGYLAVREGAAPTIEGNEILASTVSVDGPGRSTLRGNRFVDGADTSISWHARGSIEANEFQGGGGIGIDTQSDVTVAGNTVHGSGMGGPGIFLRDAGTRATIEGNTIVDSSHGIDLGSGTAGRVTGNVILDNAIGVVVDTSGAVVADNDIQGGTFGIRVSGAVAPRISGNSVQDVDMQGIYVGSSARPTLLRNVICGSRQNLFVVAGAEPILEDNEVCADTPAT